jgi:rhamnosyltransferase
MSNGQPKIFATIVTYNPNTDDVRRAIGSLKSQVAGAILFDNDSTPQIRKVLQDIQHEFDGFMSLILSTRHENVGVAINRCIRQAREHGAQWTVNFDGDSVAPPAMISSLMAAYDAMPPQEQERIGSLAPNYTMPKGLALKGDKPYYSNGAIMSGMLIKASIFDKIGYIHEIISLDGVDGEFCMRMLRAGFKTLSVPSVVLEHTIANPTLKKFFGKTVTVYNPKPYRYYTLSRNCTWMFVRNFKTYIIGNEYWYEAIWAVLIPRYVIKMLLFEDRRWEKLKLYFRGTFDGLFNRMERERLEEVLNTHS